MKIKLITIEDTKTPQISQVLALLNSEKKIAANIGDEEKANNCWRELEALELNILFIQVFHNLKSKNYRQAWNDLEQCEIKYKFICENSTPTFLENSRLKFIENKVFNFQSLYPYCMFCSPGFKVGYYSCSICGHRIKPRSRCEHKKGKLYNGQLCLHVAHDMEFIELSVVTKPVQKYSVMHDDSTLNFTLIERLINYLDHAFEDWDVQWTKMKFPIERFNRVSKNDKCPCKSEETFGTCCMEKKEVEIPHVNFIFSKPLPSDAENITFPY